MNLHWTAFLGERDRAVLAHGQFADEVSAQELIDRLGIQDDAMV